jgi:hypothetical protein
MAQYDPQRSRTRHRKADDEGPAPVDALLGPDPEASPSPVPTDDSTVPWIDPRPDLLQSSGHPSRSAPRVALALAAVIALIVLLGAAVRRRRRRPPQID